MGLVHCETTTGLLNPLSDLVTIIKEAGKIVLVDAVSSFGGYPIFWDEIGVDVVMTTANKCLQGVPGVGIVFATRVFMDEIHGQSRSFSLDLHAQWRSMEDFPGKWRFTSPTHSVQALSTALKELAEEGGVTQRAERYHQNQVALQSAMNTLGFVPYLSPEWQSHILMTFRYPSPTFDFHDFYTFIKARGYLIYPGKLTHTPTFRVATIGNITENDIQSFAAVVKDYRNFR